MTKVAQALGLSWLLTRLSSTIGQKLVMGVTGLLLCGFLVVHLAGNLLLFSGEEHYNHYAHTLHSNELLPVAQAGLAVLFLLHVILAFTTARKNTSARPIGYAVKETKQKGQTLSFQPHNYMFMTGMIVLGFLILHITDMKFADMNLRLQTVEGETPAQATLRVLHDPISAGVYVLGTLVLGFHLSHGFQSAFQSLGLNHPKYMLAIKRFGLVFAIAIALGFASLPLYFFLNSSP